MKVLVGCEFSQIVTKAFRSKGHEAFSCDILPTEGNPSWHFQEDILEVIKRERFDLGIFHPPCTYLCNSGVRWLHEKEGRWDQMREGALFFKALLEADISRICVENPVMHKYAKEIIGQNFTQSIQPWQFGHGEVKRTCLWLKNLPPLEPTDIVDGRTPRVHHTPPGPDQWRLRSITYQGVANAMSEQWSNLN